MAVLLALIFVLASIIAYIAYLSKKANAHWKDKGIPYVEPNLFVGNMLDVVLMRQSQGEAVRQICEKFPNAPTVGYVAFFRPILIVKEPKYIESILVTDFSHFVNRNIQVDADFSPLQSNLFNLTGNKWRAIRTKLSPIFTSGRLKNMFNQNTTMVGEDLTHAISSEKMECVDLRSTMGRFAMDTIGLYGFGITSKSLKNPGTEFENMGKQVLNAGTWSFVKLMIAQFFPIIAKTFKLIFISDEVQNFFIDLIRKTVDERVKNNVQRNDFIDLMLQLKNKGHIEIQSKDASDDYLRMDILDNNATEKYEMSDDLLVGNAFVFLAAGYDAFASTLTFTLYQLAKNPDIQDKLRKEIVDKIKEHGKINFDTIKDMTYLDMCLKESFRRHSPSQIVIRNCSKDYTFANGLSIKVGQTIFIPVTHVHTDPQIYPDPLKYDPERFHPDAYQEPCSFLTFGEGPRMCIAMRFSLLQLKFGIINTIMNFKIDLNPKTKEPVRPLPSSFINTPADPIYFNLTKINN